MSNFGAAIHSEALPEECSICLMALADNIQQNPVCVLCDDSNKRVCMHFFHEECATKMSESGRTKMCPQCRHPYRALRRIPDPLVDPDTWFQIADANESQSLCRPEVINALKATLCLDWAKLEQGVAQNWSRWDINNNGSICIDEFKAPGVGLLSYIMHHFRVFEPFPCPICCVASLSEGGGGVSVLMKGGRRACRHYMHTTCLPTAPNSEDGYKCPMCEQPYDSTVVMPDPREDPSLWFHLVDFDGSGSLSKQEVVEAVKSTISCNWKQLEEQLNDVYDVEGNLLREESLWRRWDTDDSGALSCEEFIASGGLLDFVLTNYPIPEVRPMPMLIADDHASYRKFFEYWDSPENGGNGDGKWEKREIRRALKKSFRNWHFSVENIDEMIDNVNVICDPDQNGEIDLEEFMLPGIGWAETLCASMSSALRSAQHQHRRK